MSRRPEVDTCHNCNLATDCSLRVTLHKKQLYPICPDWKLDKTPDEIIQELRLLSNSLIAVSETLILKCRQLEEELAEANSKLERIDV